MRRATWLVLGALVPSCRPSPPATTAVPVVEPRITSEDVVPRWRAPDCFGYSSRARTYACFDASSGSDAGVAGLVDFETMKAPPQTAWNGHKAIVLLGVRVIELASKEYGIGLPIEHHRSTADAVRDVLADGYDVPVLRRVPLPVAEWTELAGIWLRFDHDVHEGSASFENHGSLRLSCAAPDGPESGRLVVENNQAEAAIAFAAEHERVLAVGFVEADGGEGAAYFNTAYERLDLEALCGAPDETVDGA